VLAALTGLFLIVSLATGGLLIAKSSDLSASEDTVTSQADDLKKKDSKIATLEGERDKAKQDLDGSKDELGTVNADKAVIAKCLKVVFQFFDAIGAGNTGKADAAAKQIDTLCGPAEALVS
jgi:hypothetical protein